MMWFIFLGDMLVMLFMIVLVVWVLWRPSSDANERAAQIPLEDDRPGDG